MLIAFSIILFILCIGSCLIYFFAIRDMKPPPPTENELLLDEISMERRAHQRALQQEKAMRVINVPTDSSGKQVMKDIHIKGEEDVAYIQESKSVVGGDEREIEAAEEKEGDVVGATIECPAAPEGIAVRREEHKCLFDQTPSGLACPSDYVVWTKDKQCYPPCPKGTKRSDNNLCIPTKVERMCQVGKVVVANSCPPNNELIRNRCYPKCPEGLMHDMNACVCVNAKRKRVEGGPSPMQCPENYEFINKGCYPKCPYPFSRVENSGACEYTLSQKNNENN